MVVTLALGFAFRDSSLWGLCVAVCVAAVIGFALLAWKSHDRMVWLRWLGLVALAGVIAQGLLGGFRVKLDALFGPNLRVIHGSIAQVYFAFLAGLTWLLAQEPRGRVTTGTAVPWLRAVAVTAVILVCTQVVLGALLRHSMTGFEQSLWQRGHLLVAFSVVAVAGWLITLMNGLRKSDQRAGRLMLVLGVLVGLQVLFGVEAWMMRFTREVPTELAPVTSIGEVVVRSAHVMTGAGVFAITTVVALWAYGTGATEVRLSAAPRLEGAA
jgi:heme A synthase